MDLDLSVPQAAPPRWSVATAPASRPRCVCCASIIAAHRRLRAGLGVRRPTSSARGDAGSRVNENNWSIDGTTFSDGVDNTQTGPLGNYIESFQEVRVDLSNNSAEFPSIGQVTVISKSGSNQLHGAAVRLLFDAVVSRQGVLCLIAGYRGPPRAGILGGRPGFPSEALQRQEPNVLLLLVRDFAGQRDAAEPDPDSRSGSMEDREPGHVAYGGYGPVQQRRTLPE